MDIERILSVAGSLASLVGLPLAIHAAIPPETSRGEISLKLFRGLTDVADRWKKVHNKYHTVFNDLRNLNAIIEQYDTVNKIQGAKFAKQISGLPTLQVACRDFTRHVNVYLGEMKDKVENEKEILKKVNNIRSAIGDEYAIKAQFIFYAQGDAISAHDEFCNLFVHLGRLYDFNRSRASSIDFDNIAIIYNNFGTYYDAYNRVILKTDEVLLNTIDFFKLIADAR